MALITLMADTFTIVGAVVGTIMILLIVLAIICNNYMKRMARERQQVHDKKRVEGSTGLEGSFDAFSHNNTPMPVAYGQPPPTTGYGGYGQPMLPMAPARPLQQVKKKGG